MRNTLLLLAILCCLTAKTQTTATRKLTTTGTGVISVSSKGLIIPSYLIVDTIITTTAYTSYFNYELHEPLYVAYKLYKGGGDCSRKGDRFSTNGLVQSATGADYKGGGYDEGHLANSKDFAYDCDLQRSTFRFYNCVPQTQSLNRGVWKVWETTIRRESQTDSLQIYCGSIFTSKKLHDIAIPDQCWKVVFSLTTGEILQCMIFENDASNTYKDILLADLRNLISYHLCF